MLRIDCLLINADVANTVRQIVGYLGHKAIAENTDPSFGHIYNELRKNGVEVDAETAAHIYANELPLEDSRFTPEEDLKYRTGSWFDQVVRAITLQKPKIGEREIGELSPAQAVAKGYANAFANNVKGDQTTKSILKTFEDFYKEANRKVLGELPNKPEGDKRTTQEVIEQGLEKLSMGYRNTETGKINGLAEMHQEVRNLMKQFTQKMEDAGDHDKAEQWNIYAKSLEDASYSMLFNSREGKQILHESLMNNGFVKARKDGTATLDWEKLAGNVNSYEQLRKNVLDSLKSKGFDEDQAHKVADSLTKEFRDIRRKILEVAERKQQRIKDSWDDSLQKEKRTLPDIVNQRVRDWKNITQFEGKEQDPLQFAKTEAQKIITDSLRNTDKYGMDFAKDSRAVDWKAMAQEPPTGAMADAMVRDNLQKQGVSPSDAAAAAHAIVRDYHQILTEKIAENAKRLLDNREAAMDRETPNRKSALSRLGELHDLGIFNGAHDRLLAHVLGVEQSDVQAIQGIKVFAEKLSRLRQILNGNDFVVPSMVHTLNREIHSILAPVISDKTKSLKIVSALNKIFQVENSMLISTHGNIIENHLSGAMELLTTNINQRLRFGSELGASHAQDRQLMADYYSHIAKGGAENGLAPWQIGGFKERLSDKYTIEKMKGADWTKPATWAKGLATGVMTIPRTFLSGADAAVKIGLMNAHMKSSVIDALISAHKGDMSKDEAVKFYNDAIYGDGQLAKATARAEQIYKNIGLNYVSKKELNIAANELLRENLLGESGITPEALEEAMKNSYHQAGLGMGHESNNMISERQQAWKQKLNREEAQAIVDHDWDKASKKRLVNTVLNDVIFRFAASRFNWAWIRAEQAGAGLLTGMWHMSATNKKYKNTDMLDSEKMNEAAREYQAARQKIARGAVGLSISMGGYLATRAIMTALYPDKKDPMEVGFDALKKNYAAKALYLKVSPLWMLQSYEYNEMKAGKPTEKALGGFLKDYINLTNVGDAHDFDVQIAEATKLLENKTMKQRDKGYALLGMTLNNSIPHVPLYKQSKNIGSLVHWMEGKPASPMPPFPHSFYQGLLGGGIIQDVIGEVSDKSLPKELKGWGKKENKK